MNNDNVIPFPGRAFNVEPDAERFKAILDELAPDSPELVEAVVFAGRIIGAAHGAGLPVDPVERQSKVKALAILAHGRRRLIHHAVTAHPTAEWVARQIVEAFPWDGAPEYLVRDRDAIYGEVVKRRLRGLGIRDRPIAPRSPQQNAYVERLIGSVRRECIDHVIVFGETHLRRIMSAYANYYNQARTHLVLGKDAPAGRSIHRFGRIIAEPMVAGLHHRYARC